MPNRELCKALNEDVHEASKKGMVWEELVTHKSKYSFQQPHTQIPEKESRVLWMVSGLNQGDTH